jgi:hypothetical protein
MIFLCEQSSRRALPRLGAKILVFRSSFSFFLSPQSCPHARDEEDAMERGEEELALRYFVAPEMSELRQSCGDVSSQEPAGTSGWQGHGSTVKKGVTSGVCAWTDGDQPRRPDGAPRW